MWHVTCDRWHVTLDTWCGVNILSKYQLSSSNGLEAMMFWISEGKGWLTHSLNDEAVCRRAPATPGLLNNIMSTNIFYLPCFVHQFKTIFFLFNLHDFEIKNLTRTTCIVSILKTFFIFVLLTPQKIYLNCPVFPYFWENFPYTGRI